MRSLVYTPGLFTAPLRKSFSLHESPCFENESQQDVSLQEIDGLSSPLNHGHDLQRGRLEPPYLLL